MNLRFPAPPLVALLALLGSPASVLAGTIQFDAHEADADSYGNGGGHAFWLPGMASGIDDDWVFDGDAVFEWDQDNGSASLTGTIQNKTNSSYRFDFDLAFTELTPEEVMNRPVTPKQELDPCVYDSNCDTSAPSPLVDTDTWAYFDFSGMLSGLDALEGAEVALTEFPTDGSHPFQLGIGASGKNIAFGGSGWLQWEVLEQPTSSILTSYGDGHKHKHKPKYKKILKNTSNHGDINLVFDQVPVPVPGVLSLLGLGLLLFAHRRRAP